MHAGEIDPNRIPSQGENAAGKSRKRPLASQLEDVTEGGKGSRRSEAMGGLASLSENEAVVASPAHQKRRSSQVPEDEDSSDAQEQEEDPTAGRVNLRAQIHPFLDAIRIWHA